VLASELPKPGIAGVSSTGFSSSMDILIVVARCRERQKADLDGASSRDSLFRSTNLKSCRDHAGVIKIGITKSLSELY